MIDLDIYLLFVGTCIVLGLIPGPNVALIVANSVAHGTRSGLVSVAGTSSAMLPQLSITIIGAATLLTVMASAFELLRWFGVLYLLYRGIMHWFFTANDNLMIEAEKKAKAHKELYWSGFWISATNPKTLLFFGAYLPQFVSPKGNIALQMIVLSVTLITIISIVDSTWAILAGKMRPLLLKFGKLHNRVSGTLFIIAGAGLALARRS
ncbi:MAG: transporter [Thermodesulfobacteriota bacterium]|nr:MAG: transporter [Thermodesulfobacteriota bacterium]